MNEQCILDSSNRSLLGNGKESWNCFKEPGKMGGQRAFYIKKAGTIVIRNKNCTSSFLLLDIE